MRRMSTVVLVVLAAGIAFAAGQAAPKLKFPWAGEKLNAPCNRTELEWRCAANRIEQLPAPVKLCREFDLIHLVGQPASKGMEIKANLTPRPKVKIDTSAGAWDALMSHATTCVLWQARTRFGSGATDKDPMDDFADVAMSVYINGELAATRTAEGMKVVMRPKP